MIASQSGRCFHSQWYHDFKSDHDIVTSVEVQMFRACAATVAGNQRQALWRMEALKRPPYDACRVKGAIREIPLLALLPE